ncbi:MAG: poly-gamma-glutamate synthase PgsB [Candidatus Aminicenantes bacterium]|nr:poly-gamma-glutamate synthase PgsB [Candidatus Aminicenantes bacterium]
MREFVIISVSVVILLVYLWYEKRYLHQRSSKIPLRICITGTRGKSGITRLLASCLNQAGFRVMAKITGSSPVFIFPHGKEKPIKRRGITSILEEKKVIRKAASRSVQALIVELMSFSPESLYAESRRMLRPHIIVITNVRMDHIAQAGNSRDKIAENFSRCIPDFSTVFIPEEEFFPVFQTIVKKRKAKLFKVSEYDSAEGKSFLEKVPKAEFIQNIRLVLSVCDFLGIQRDLSYAGIQKAIPDIGSLKYWRAEFSLPKRRWELVSAFSANDPKSTRDVVDKLVKSKNIKNSRWIGLFNIRKDRGDRTHQWISAFENKLFPEFQKIVFIGDQSELVKKRLEKRMKGQEFDAFRNRNPKQIMSRLLEVEKHNCVCVGLGNIGGTGIQLLDHWDTIGIRHEL